MVAKLYMRVGEGGFVCSWATKTGGGKRGKRLAMMVAQESFGAVFALAYR